jgi:hypothetical protein
MSQRSACSALLPLIVMLILVNASIAAQEIRKNLGVPDSDTNESPLFVFKSVERAWQAGDAQALASLASESKVFMEIRGIQRRGGYFTKPQIFYIFKGMFASTSQTGFVFVRYHNLEKRDSRIYGMAVRSYKDNRSGGLYKDRVYVTLVNEGSRWAVTEIKSTW